MDAGAGVGVGVGVTDLKSKHNMLKFRNNEQLKVERAAQKQLDR